MGIDGSAVNLLKPKLDLLSPRFFGAFLGRLIQALNQRIDERGAPFGRKRESVPEQFGGVSLHDVILSCGPLRLAC